MPDIQENRPGELFLYGEVAPDSATKFVEKLNKIDAGNITLRINSPGGDVFEGLAIMNALRSHPAHITAVVEGLAASAASFIAVGGADRVVMRPTAEMMVHNAMAMAIGNANDIDKLSGDLRRMSTKIAGIYSDKSGADASEWQAAMDAETWFTAEEAVAANLADAIEDGRREREPVSAFAGAGIMNKFIGRRGTPPEALLNHPEGGERGGGMSLTNLARELGWDEGELVSALTRLKNEAVSISGEVEVSYPADVKIVPTERIKVEPVIGDKALEPVEGDPVEGADPVESEGDSPAVALAKSAGMTFAMGDIAEGFTAEVDEGGVVTITAPSGAEVGSTAAFTVMVNDTAVALGVTVRSLSDEPEEAPEDAAPVEAVAPPVEQQPVNTVTLDADTYNDLKMAAKLGWQAKNKADAAERAGEVDKWIAEGRVNVARREKIVAHMEQDADGARALYGSIPKGTIPRAEVGYGREEVEKGKAAKDALNSKAAKFFAAPDLY